VLNTISLTLALRQLARRAGPILLATMSTAAAIIALGTWLLLNHSLTHSAIKGANNATSFRAVGQYQQRTHRRSNHFTAEQLKAIEHQLDGFANVIGVASMVTTITTNTGTRIPLTIQITTPEFMDNLGVVTQPIHKQPEIQPTGATISTGLKKELSDIHNPEIYLNQIPLGVGRIATQFTGFSTTVEKTLWIDYDHHAAQSALDPLNTDPVFVIAVDTSKRSTSEIQAGLDLLASTRPDLFDDTSIQILGSIRYGAELYSNANRGLSYISFSGLLVAIFAITASLLHVRSTTASMTTTLAIMESLGSRWPDKALILLSDLTIIIVFATLISFPGIQIALESTAKLTGINESMASIDTGQVIFAAALVSATIFIPLVILSLIKVFRPEGKSAFGKGSIYMVGIQFSFFMISVFTFSILTNEFVQISTGQKNYSFEGVELTKIDFGFSRFPTYDATWHNAVRQLVSRLNSGASSAALASTLAPLSGEQWEDGVIYTGDQERRVKINRVSPEYFSMIGLNVSGETPEFSYFEEDYRSPGHAVVNSSLLSAIPDAKEQGQIALATLDEWERMPADAARLPAISRQISGAVSEGSSGVSGPTFISGHMEALQPIAYLIDTWFSRAILLTRNVPQQRIESELHSLEALAPDLSIEWRKSGEDIVKELLARERSLLTLIFIMTFGAASISILSALSLVQSWLIQNGRALAIRRALGATSMDIYHLVFRNFSRILVLTIALYVPFSIFTAAFLEKPLDPFFLTFNSAPGIILVVLLFCLILITQHRKLHRIDMRALSDE